MGDPVDASDLWTCSGWSTAGHERVYRFPAAALAELGDEVLTWQCMAVEVGCQPM